MQQAVRDAVEGRLGLRSTAERTADAVVHGTVTRYDPDVPVAYTGGPAGTTGRTVEVTRRMVQLTVDIDIVDQKTGASLWKRSGLLVNGDYEPGQEGNGRKKALDKLADEIVQGAQSQW